MLSRIAFPPLALQAAMFPLGIAILCLNQGVGTSDEAWAEFAVFCFALGLVGFIVFLPVHWVVLGIAAKLHAPASRLHFILAAMVVAFFLISSDWAAALSVLLAPCLAFMGLTTWAAETRIRRQEAKEQRATDAFVLAREQMLKQPTKS